MQKSVHYIANFRRMNPTGRKIVPPDGAILPFWAKNNDFSPWSTFISPGKEPNLPMASERGVLSFPEVAVEEPLKNFAKSLA